MKKNIISILLLCFMTFAVLLAANELSKSDFENTNKVTEATDLNY